MTPGRRLRADTRGGVTGPGHVRRHAVRGGCAFFCLAAQRSVLPAALSDDLQFADRHLCLGLPGLRRTDPRSPPPFTSQSTVHVEVAFTLYLPPAGSRAAVFRYGRRFGDWPACPTRPGRRTGALARRRAAVAHRPRRSSVTFAFAVTVTPASDAEAVLGPYVVGLSLTHIHIGTPTDVLAGRAGAGDVRAGSVIESTTRWPGRPGRRSLARAARPATPSQRPRSSSPSGATDRTSRTGSVTGFVAFPVQAAGRAAAGSASVYVQTLS